MSDIDTDKLSSILAETASITKEEASLFLKSLTSVVAQHLRNGEEVEVQGLGKFVVIDTQQSEMRRVALMLSDVMKNEVNSPFSFFEPCVIAKGKVEKAEETVAAEETMSPSDNNAEEEREQKEQSALTETTDAAEQPALTDTTDAAEQPVLTDTTDAAEQHDVTDTTDADSPADKKQEDRQQDSFVRKYLQHLVVILIKAIVPIGIVYFLFSLCDRQAEEADVTPPVAAQDTVVADTVQTKEEPEALPTFDLMLDSLGLPVTVEALEGDMLTSLAQRHLGNKAFWPYLYWVNRDVLASPSALLRGQVLRLPNTEYFAIDAADPESLEKANDFGTKLLKQ